MKHHLMQVLMMQDRMTHLNYLLHFRCGDHTIELMISNLANSFPLLQEAIHTSKSFVTAVRGTKSLWKALKDVQVAAGVKKPLSVFLSGNTRKWSSGYFMISRLLQLRSYIESHSDYKSSHFQLIDAAKEYLFIPYLLEQIYVIQAMEFI